jgi:hypothetical protein
MNRTLLAAYPSFFVLAVAIGCSSRDFAGSEGSGGHSGTAGQGGAAGGASTLVGGADSGGSNAVTGVGGAGASGIPEGGSSDAGAGAVAGGEGGATQGGASSNDGGATASGGYCAGKPAVALPMVVSDRFLPLGWLNDTMDLRPIQDPCPSRPASPVGECFTYEWTPTTSTWAGVEFQYPAYNWDAKPGLCVQDGAKFVRAKVRGAVGGEKVKLIGPKVFTTIHTLTTNWEELELSLEGVDYNNVNPQGGVDGAVGLVFMDPAPGKQRVYIDDIRWE